MELRRYLALLRQRMALVAVTVVAGLAGGYVVGRHAPIYQSQTALYVAFRLPAGQSGTDIIQIDQVLATYAALVRSSPVAEAAVEASHAPRIAAKVIAETSSAVIPNTNIILVTVSDQNRLVAQSLAKGMASSFIAQAQTLAPAAGDSANTPTVTVFQPAGLPAAPLPTARKRDVALGGFFGLTASVALVLLVDYLDTTIKSVEDLEKDRDLTVLGTIGWTRPGSATGPMGR